MSAPIAPPRACSQCGREFVPRRSWHERCNLCVAGVSTAGARAPTVRRGRNDQLSGVAAFLEAAFADPSDPATFTMARRLIDSLARGDPCLGVPNRFARDEIAAAFTFAAMRLTSDRSVVAVARQFEELQTDFEREAVEFPDPEWDRLRRYAWFAWRLGRLPTRRSTLESLLARVVDETAFRRHTADAP